MQNHEVKVGSFGYLKIKLLFGQLQLYDSGVAFWTMHQGKHGHCHSAIIDCVLDHRMRFLDQIQDTELMPVPSACRFSKALLPRIAWCSKLQTLFCGQRTPFHRGLVRKWARFLLLIFCQAWRKVVDFQGLLWGAFSCPFLSQAY